MNYLKRRLNSALVFLSAIGLASVAGYGFFAGSAKAQTAIGTEPAFSFKKCLAIYSDANPQVAAKLLSYLATAPSEERKSYLYVVFIARADYANGWFEAGDAAKQLALAEAKADQFKPEDILKIETTLDSERADWEKKSYTNYFYQPSPATQSGTQSNAKPSVGTVQPAISVVSDSYSVFPSSTNSALIIPAFQANGPVKASSGFSTVNEIQK